MIVRRSRGRRAERREGGGAAAWQPGAPRAHSEVEGAGEVEPDTVSLALFGANHTSLFRRLVLICINADFGVQMRIFQHFSRSLQENNLLANKICKFLQIVCKQCTVRNFNFLRILQTISKLVQESLN